MSEQTPFHPITFFLGCEFAACEDRGQLARLGSAALGHAILPKQSAHRQQNIPSTGT